MSNDEDRWHLFLTNRDAELAYLTVGTHIASAPSCSSLIKGRNDQEVRDQVFTQIGAGRVALLDLEVHSNLYVWENTRYVYLEMATKMI